VSGSDIDKLEEVNRRGASTINISEVMPHEEKSWASIEKIDKHVRHKGKGALLNNATGPPNVLPKGRRKGSAKKKVV
jgi:hypothetical protein